MSSQGTNEQVFVKKLHSTFLEKAKEAISEIPDITEKARVQFCLKEFSQSVFLKLQECIESSNKAALSSKTMCKKDDEYEDMEPVDRKLALRVASLSDQVIELGKKLEEKRVSAPAEIAEALEEEMKMKNSEHMNSVGSLLKAVQGEEVNVTAIDKNQFQRMKENLLSISTILPDLESNLSTLLENSKQTVEAVEKFVSKEKTQVDLIIETEKFKTEKPSKAVVDFLPADENQNRVVSCVKLADGISSVLDKKRSFASTCLPSQTKLESSTSTSTPAQAVTNRSTGTDTSSITDEGISENEEKNCDGRIITKNNSDSIRKKPRLISNVKCLRV